MKTASTIIIVLLVAGGIIYNEYQEREEEAAQQREEWTQQAEEIRATKERLEEALEAKRLDDEAWTSAWATNTISSYEEYLYSFPAGEYISDAKQAKEQLEEQARIDAYYQLQAEVYSLAEQAGNDIIIKAYDNGINKYTQILDWAQVSDSQIDVAVQMTWNGDFITTNYYEAKGIIHLTFQNDQVSYSWKPTNINPTLAQYHQDVNEFEAGAMVTIAGLAALSELFSE